MNKIINRIACLVLGHDGWTLFRKNGHHSWICARCRSQLIADDYED